MVGAIISCHVSRANFHVVSFRHAGMGWGGDVLRGVEKALYERWCLVGGFATHVGDMVPGC